MMVFNRNLRALLVVILLAGACLAFQRRGRVPFLADDDEPEPYPADAGEKTEWVFARLRYNSYRQGAGMWGVRG
ncbi:MAG: hypothetical protein ACK5TN_20375, partial [Acidobacteriota bacterium]